MLKEYNPQLFIKITFLYFIFSLPAGIANEITTDNFVQSSTDRSNWEPGGSNFTAILQEQRIGGVTTNRQGSLNITRTYSQQTGNMLVQRVTISGTYGYDINFNSTNHPYEGHSEFSTNITGTNSSTLQSTDRKITVNLNWSGTLTHPIDAYNGDTPNGIDPPHADGARDIYSYNITGTATAIYTLTPEESTPVIVPFTHAPTLPQNPTIISPQSPINDVTIDDFQHSNKNQNQPIGTPNFVPNFEADFSISPKQASVVTYDITQTQKHKYNIPFHQNDFKGAPNEESNPFKKVIPFFSDENTKQKPIFGQKSKDRLPKELLPNTPLKQAKFLQEDNSKPITNNNDQKLIARDNYIHLISDREEIKKTKTQKIARITFGNTNTSPTNTLNTYDNTQDIATSTSPIPIILSAPSFNQEHL